MSRTLELEQHQTALQRHLDHLIQLQRPLAGVGRRINYEAVARGSGVPVRRLRADPSLKALVEEAGRALGVEDQGRPARLRARPTLPEAGQPTYRELLATAPQQFRDTRLSESSLPSYRSALNRWMAHFGVGEGDQAHAQFGSDFPQALAEFAQTESPSTNSRLRWWADAYKKLADQQAKLPTNFADALDVLIERSGRSRNALAQELGISHASINKWVNGGSLPTQRDVVERLERALGAHPGSLMELYAPIKRRRLDSFRRVPEEWWPQDWQVQVHHQGDNTPFRRNRRAVLMQMPESVFFEDEATLQAAFGTALQAVRASEKVNGRKREHGRYSREKYGLPTSAWPNQATAEWNSLVEYKSAEIGFRNRDRIGRWNPRSTLLHGQKLVYFFGYLTLPPDAGKPIMSGKGMSVAEVSLTLVSMLELVEDYLTFRRLRSGGFNTETKLFIDFVTSMLRPKSGWLWRLPEQEALVALPEAMRQSVVEQGGWQIHCETTRRQLLDALKQFTKAGDIQQTRDTFRLILPLLKLDQPLAPIVHRLKLHRRELDIQSHTHPADDPGVAAGWRDHLLISFLARFPLRARHWCEMTYRPGDNTGHLRRNGRGWELVLPYTDFKNHANTHIFERRGDGLLTLDFSTPQYEILHQLSALLDLYTACAWPVLARGSDLLFPTQVGTSLNPTTLGAAILQWTSDYIAESSTLGHGIPGVRPFRTHAFRDLVATSLVKNASIDDAASALLDSRQMVEKHYARFVPADRLKKAFTALGPAFAGSQDPL